MTQSIFVQVGQCGNQIGHRFWDLALREHATVNKTGRIDDSMRSFFYTHQSAIRARAVLVDMEEGVVQGLKRGALGKLFDTTNLITDVSGSGNNWAVGYCMYGGKHKERILESLRRAAEACDCLQCFFILHSLGGGTGSGIGSFITGLLADEFPEVFRIVTAVFPSLNDDVITSPYNTLLALNQMTEHTDCILSVDNQALAAIVKRAGGSTRDPGSLTSSAGSSAQSVSRTKAFDDMNNIVANMLLNLTSSARFQGTMNVDLNELSANLVPFPRLNYLLPAQSPITCNSAVTAPRNVDQIFKDAFSSECQLISVKPKEHTFLASSLLTRGCLCASDIRRNIERLQQHLRFVSWNYEGWKVGHCQVPAVGQKASLLAISNNTGIGKVFGDLLGRFHKLMRKKAHIHHYINVDGFEASHFDASVHSVRDLIEDYAFFEKEQARRHGEPLPCLKIAD